LAALEKALRDLYCDVENHYKEGTRVSFRKFSYHGMPAPVLTGTISWVQVRQAVGIEVIASIDIDKEFLPIDWPLHDIDGRVHTRVRLNILNTEYDVTIID
jgi:hypothetical protein